MRNYPEWLESISMYTVNLSRQDIIEIYAAACVHREQIQDILNKKNAELDNANDRIAHLEKEFTNMRDSWIVLTEEVDRLNKDGHVFQKFCPVCNFIEEFCPIFGCGKK